jgi:hypothetical protein
MRTFLTVALVLGLAGGLAAQEMSATAPAAQSAVTVEAVLARSVVDRAPQDTGVAFPAEVGELVLWTRVTGGAGQTLNHVWFYGDTEVANVPLTIGGSPWRTWSRKTIPVEATGAWRVEIRDAAGTVLKQLDFTVGQ